MNQLNYDETKTHLLTNQLVPRRMLWIDIYVLCCCSPLIEMEAATEYFLSPKISWFACCFSFNGFNSDAHYPNESHNEKVK